MTAANRTVLWWGRFDPGYSRNRILRQAYAALGWRVKDFHPTISAAGDLEARLRRVTRADLVHVPCFRQRDVAAAARFARRHGIPLLFDPLISAFDKQVYERRKFSPCSRRARLLLDAEQRQFAAADVVLADTPEHARFFAENLLVEPAKLKVVYVGAEESLFHAEPVRHTPNQPPEILFYGSFIRLQGPEVIVEAARRYQGPPVHWTLLGDGPLKRECRALGHGLPNLGFEDWIPYARLPARIRRADILLGVFGDSPKAQRVIPNKVFQALACGMPLVTCSTPAYPETLRNASDSGIVWVPPGDAAALAQAVAALATAPQSLHALGAQARATYQKHFSEAIVTAQLHAALAVLPSGSGR
jgi:glycosyltransferase involved in cell wall biosynthesis